MLEILRNSYVHDFSEIFKDVDGLVLETKEDEFLHELISNFSVRFSQAAVIPENIITGPSKDYHDYLLHQAENVKKQLAKQMLQWIVDNDLNVLTEWLVRRR